MSTPYQLLSADARNEVVRRQTFYERKARECEDFLRTIDALPSFFDEHPIPDAVLPTSAAPPPRHAVVENSDAAREDVAPPAHRRKEDLYDEEMRCLLARVKVASKMAVFQHFHRTLRGNTSIGAVESYLKRAVLRGVLVRKRRGEYTTAPKTG